MYVTRFTAEWGDCAEAGIVFYLNYFYWIDCAFQRLLRDRGLSQREIRRRYGAVTPLVDAGAQFRTPVRYDDELAIAVEVAEWQERRFKVCYRIMRGTDLAVEAYELRAWALLNGEGRLHSAPIDVEFRRLLV